MTGVTSIVYYGGDKMYLMAYDSSQKFIKIDFATSEYIIQDISSTYKVLDTLFTSPSFFFAGHSTGFSDGTITKSFSSQQGFIMTSLTTDESQNCLSSSHDWNPTSGLTAYSNDATIVW